MKDGILKYVDWAAMVVVWGLFVLWQNYQSEGALNLLLAFVWFMMFWHILILFGIGFIDHDSETAKKVREKYERHTTQIIVARISSAAMYCALAWFGHSGLAVVAAFIWILEVCRMQALIEGDK